MPYLTEDQIHAMRFRFVGAGVKISTRCAIYDAEKISIGDGSRIDDFCILSGEIAIGGHCHVTPQCLLAGGRPGIELADFCTLAYGVKIFAQSDDYSGESLTNSTVPREFKRETFAAVRLHRHVIVGANSCILPGVTVGEGCSVGAMSLLTRSTEPWGIYYGVPATRRRDRSRNLLRLEAELTKRAQQ